MKPFAAALLLLAAALAPAQDWAKKRLDASPRHQEWITLKNGDRSVKCFVVYPERKDKAPVVVLIHEIFGASDWFLSAADQLAEHGFIAVAPDLLTGLGPNGGRTDSFTDRSKVTEAVSGLPAEQVTGDLNAACEYAKTIPSANGKIAVAGFCWGGGKSFQFATDRSDIVAAFVFYGTPPSDPAAIGRIKAPVFGFYGGNDNRVDATIPDAQKAMKDAGKTYDAVVYDGAGHGFMRAGEQPDAMPANKKAHDEAWKRWIELLNKYADTNASKSCCDG